MKDVKKKMGKSEKQTQLEIERLNTSQVILKNCKKEIRQLKKELSKKDRRIEDLEIKLKLRLKPTKKKKDILEGLR